MKKFTGKVVLITGSSKGIGKATAKLFADHGAKIILNYNTSKTEAIEFASKIKTSGGDAIAIKCDVTKEEEVKKMVEESLLYFGKIDILINNAGYAKFVPILERTIDDWRKTLDVNLIGQYLCIKYVAVEMLKNKSGKIINIASTSGIHNYDHFIADYDAAKSGVITMTKNFSKALAPHIYVNAIAPGWVDTDMNADLSLDFIQNESSQVYIHRFARPEEIANAIIFLSSDEASYINGAVLVVDGGHD